MPEYKTKRLFVAVVPDDVVAADVWDAVRGVEVTGLRLTKPENLHITVKFLGDVADPDAPGIIEALREVAGDVGAFELTSGRVVVMPDIRRPRGLAVEFDFPVEFKKLVEGVEDAMEVCGFRREGRAFRAHMTVGRFKFRGGPPRDFRAPVVELAETGFRVEKVVLMESDLSGDGPVYARMAEFELREGLRDAGTK